MPFFKYGMVVDCENYCQRPVLARQFSKLVEVGLNVVVQGERRMGKTSFVYETVSTMRSGLPPGTVMRWATRKSMQGSA